MSVADKRAALELHGLSPEDREWVLGRLPTVEQARVRPLLAELDAMNVRFDVESEASALDDEWRKRSEPMTAAAAAEMPARSIVRDAPATDVMHVLSTEPAWLSNAVLAIDTWPWSAAVRSGLAQNGVRTTQTRKDVSPPPALAAALLSLLAERLPAVDTGRYNGHVNGHRHAIDGIGTPHGIWPRVKQWLR